MKTILFTQCLQNDFVKPVGKYDHLPNLLHIGYEESTRLMGLIPEEGPISVFMNWASLQVKRNFKIVHIRDWHDPSDENQKKHLQQFGDHCIIDTPGADFIFKLKKSHIIINSVGLNDFIDTPLVEFLNAHKGEKVRIGIIGVWTEAKVFFLAYDILTRYPSFEVAVCSALTASSSIYNHYFSLDQLKKILNVHVYNSIGEFTNYLSWNKQGLELSLKDNNGFPDIIMEKGIQLSEIDYKLMKYVFRGSRSVSLKILDGGFSGNLVFGSESIDLNGHSEAPNVIKIGNQESVGKERMSFEKIEPVLGNNAPRITDFADNKGRGIIKYRYASMGKEASFSFQRKFTEGTSLTKIEQYLDAIFKDELGKFYVASTYEKINLFEYYGFNTTNIEGVKKNIENVYQKSADAYELEFENGIKFPNPYFFYKKTLPHIKNKLNNYSFISFVHGDLNGANILIDQQENVWIIDFFHSHRGHVLKDVVKLENDLLYIYTKIKNQNEFLEALKISEILFATKDLAKPLPPVEETDIKMPAFKRTYKTLRILRSFYPDLIKFDRNPTQLFIAQLRYSMHTLSFEESDEWQKKWALYNSGIFSQIIFMRIKESGPLRINFIPKDAMNQHLLGLTILPGRKDFSRDLLEDIKELKKENIDVVIPLITHDEMDDYDVPNLIKLYRKNKIEVRELPILDQKVPSIKQVKELMQYMDTKFAEGKNILIHCVGGLGRSGLIAACYLKHLGYTSEEAIHLVRRVRTSRAIETREQEKFVHAFPQRKTKAY